MVYKNAREILPERLLSELQKYVEGTLIYVPGRDSKCEWGVKSGARTHYAARNSQIAAGYAQGSSISCLADEYCLSEDSIKKILRKRICKCV